MNRKKNIQEKIILPAWKVIKEDSKIKKFYIIPGILSIIFLTGILTYQTIYTYVKFGGKEEEFLYLMVNFIENKYIIEALIILVIFLLIYFLLTPIFEAGLIIYLKLKSEGSKLSKSEIFGQGIYNFLPMFEYNNFFSELKLLSILNFYLFSIRFVGIGLIKVVTYVFLGIFIFSLVLNILIIYSKYFIIIEKKGIFNSIGKSIKLTIFDLPTTVRIFLMMFLLNLRIIINFIIFLFFPIFIAIAISIVSTKFLLILTISIIVIIFVSLIILLGYLSAVLEIFKTAIWYYAYLNLKERYSITEKK